MALSPYDLACRKIEDLSEQLDAALKLCEAQRVEIQNALAVIRAQNEDLAEQRHRIGRLRARIWALREEHVD